MQVRATFVTKCDQVRRGAILYIIVYMEELMNDHASSMNRMSALRAAKEYHRRQGEGDAAAIVETAHAFLAFLEQAAPGDE